MLFPTAQPGDAGFRAEIHGQKNVLAFKTHAKSVSDVQRDQLGSFPLSSLRYVTELEVPDLPDPQLKLRVGHETGEDWVFTVEANGQQLNNSYINNDTVPTHWQTIQVSLASFRKQRVRLVLTASVPDKGKPAWVYLSDIQLP